MRNLVSKKLDHLETFQKIKYNGIFYSSSKNLTKRCDSCIISNKNQIGLIDFFIVDTNRILCLSRKIVPMFNSYFLQDCPDIKSNLYVCYISDETFIEDIINIKKIVLINISDQNCFVSMFNIFLVDIKVIIFELNK
jgi:hypothetical protein